MSGIKGSDKKIPHFCDKRSVGSVRTWKLLVPSSNKIKFCSDFSIINFTNKFNILESASGQFQCQSFPQDKINCFNYTFFLYFWLLDAQISYIYFLVPEIGTFIKMVCIFNLENQYEFWIWYDIEWVRVKVIGDSWPCTIFFLLKLQ